IELLEKPRSVSPSREREEAIRVGSKVEGRYRGREKWYPGVVTRVNSDGSYDIDYDDGEKETRVRREYVRLIEVYGSSRSPKKSSTLNKLRVGAKVKARYRGRDKWFPGVISNDREDGTYDIDYDDGEKETRVRPEL